MRDLPDVGAPENLPPMIGSLDPWAHLGSGSTTLEPCPPEEAPVSVNDVCRVVVTRFRASAKKHGSAVDCDPSTRYTAYDVPEPVHASWTPFEP